MISDHSVPAFVVPSIYRSFVFFCPLGVDILFDANQSLKTSSKSPKIVEVTHAKLSKR